MEMEIQERNTGYDQQYKNDLTKEQICVENY
jgi:hypothetical protein